MNKAMTLQEVTNLCGYKSTKTLLKWIRNNGQNLTMIGQKMTEAQKTKKPAQFTLHETIEIVRAGKNEALANLLMQNAQSSQQTAVGSSLTNRDLDIISALVSKTIAATT